MPRDWTYLLSAKRRVAGGEDARPVAILEGRIAVLLTEGLKVRVIAAATGWQENYYVRWLVQQVYRKQGFSGSPPWCDGC